MLARAIVNDRHSDTTPVVVGLKLTWTGKEWPQG
jgi:hypothetical protein